MSGTPAEQVCTLNDCQTIVRNLRQSRGRPIALFKHEGKYYKCRVIASRYQEWLKDDAYEHIGNYYNGVPAEYIYDDIQEG